MKSLKSFLTAVLPSGTDVIAGQPNRVPEPSSKNFCVMTPIRYVRLRTNQDDYHDVAFTGSIAATAMTVSVIAYGAIAAGSTVFGVGIAANTTITSQLSGTTGGIGTYAITPSQTITSRTLATGTKSLEQGAEAVVQLDFHSDDLSSADMAQIVSTTLRDNFGVRQFADQSPNYGVVPLYADDPRQAVFFNEAQQAESRWIVEAHLQVNAVVSVPAQFASVLTVTPVSVDATYPP